MPCLPSIFIARALRDAGPRSRVAALRDLLIQGFCVTVYAARPSESLPLSTIKTELAPPVNHLSVQVRDDCCPANVTLAARIRRVWA